MIFTLFFLHFFLFCLLYSPYFEKKRNKYKGACERALLSVCLPNPVARQWLGKRFPTAKNTHNNRRIAGRGVFYDVRVVSNKYVVKGEQLLVLTRTSSSISLPPPLPSSWPIIILFLFLFLLPVYRCSRLHTCPFRSSKS
jgi:hypothetical protein